MRKILRGIWWLLGLGVSCQYLYWLATMAGWWLGKTEWPAISGDWMFLAIGTAFIFSMERIFPALRDIT